MLYSLPTNHGLVDGLKLIDVEEQKEFDGRRFPCALSPDSEDRFENIESLERFVKENKQFLEQVLYDNGALLFRGFPLHTAEHFDRFVKAFGRKKFVQQGGGSPRRPIVGDVVSANDSPPDQKIPFHHELAQTPEPPNLVFFYCDQPPAAGGQTPLVLSNLVYREMKNSNPQFVERLEKEGVRYARVVPDGDDVTSGIGSGWQSTFRAKTREEAEEAAKKFGVKWEWDKEGNMRTETKVLPAIRVDKRSGRPAWFNMVHDAYYGWQDTRNDSKRNIMFADGAFMPGPVMEQLDATMCGLSVGVPWQRGDVMMIDNWQVLHSRASFTPPRRIYVCLCH